MHERGVYGKHEGRGTYGQRPGGWLLTGVVAALAVTAYLMMPAAVSPPECAAPPAPPPES